MIQKIQSILKMFGKEYPRSSNYPVLVGLWIASGNYMCVGEIVKAEAEVPEGYSNQDFLEDTDDEDEMIIKWNTQQKILIQKMIMIIKQIIKNAEPEPEANAEPSPEPAPAPKKKVVRRAVKKKAT